MIGQTIADGLLTGAILSLGAIGYSLSAQILKFANFAHAELLTWGAYIAVVFTTFATAGTPLGPLSFGWQLIVAVGLAGVGTAMIAVVVDTLIFSKLRDRAANSLTLVFASFGAALVLRNLILLFWGAEARYYSQELQFAVQILPDVLLLPDQVFILALTAILVVALYLFLRYSSIGVAMRAMADRPELARVCGINITSVVRWTWVISGMLAAASGVFTGLTVQIRPELGLNMLLGIMTAAILGGAGSLFGAVAGGLIVGLAESFSVLVIPASYKTAMPFILLLLVLYVRPQGLFSKPTRS